MSSMYRKNIRKLLQFYFKSLEIMLVFKKIRILKQLFENKNFEDEKQKTRKFESTQEK